MANEKLNLTWNGFCPESHLQGKQVRMRLNQWDFYESEETRLQICVLTGTQAVILNFRGEGKFRSTPNYADDIESGERLSPQNTGKAPFNSPTEVFGSGEAVEKYIASIK